MSIKPEPQSIIVAAEPFTVTLTTDDTFETGHMSICVDDVPRAYSLRPNEAPALVRLVTASISSSVTVQGGWGTDADKGKSLVVTVDGNPSTTVIIR